MVWNWIFFGLMVLCLLFLVIYLLDHWKVLDRKQRTSFICNIITILGIVIIGWSMFKTNQKLEMVQQQQESETIRTKPVFELDKNEIVYPIQP